VLQVRHLLALDQLTEPLSHPQAPLIKGSFSLAPSSARAMPTIDKSERAIEASLGPQLPFSA
jgi:hypothetical protein